MDVFRTAYVYVRDDFAGILEECDAGYRFTYDKNYLSGGSASPVSLTMPLSSDPYVSGTLFPFFDGLIPEGWLLDIVTHNWKIDRSDRFGLLLIACKDPIGNVSVKEALA